VSKHSKKHRRFYLLTLGCPKNSVDSEAMSELLIAAGYQAAPRPGRADYLIVNTCGFLEAAKTESIEALRELAARKRAGQRLVAVGCLAQRMGVELARYVPGLDGLIGTRSWPDLVSFLAELADAQQPASSVLARLSDSASYPPECLPLKRDSLGRRATAYLKIGDGCSASCAFCTIPGFKGPARSRPRQLILDEARALVEQGTRELILVAQDIMAYGRDWGERDALPGLIEDVLRAAPEVRWVRLMYAYPNYASQRLIEVMAGHAQVCHYLDMPLQHGHPDTLRRMGRPHQVDKTLRWIEALRAAMPDVALRTAFIVGYPGETPAEFQGLLDFMQAVQFDRVGIFTFSREPGTPAYDLPHQVPEEVKQERYQVAMQLQRKISLTRNQAQVGRQLDVLVDGVGDGVSLARSYRDAPEVDGFVILQEEHPVGEFVAVRVVGAGPYDLMAVPLAPGRSLKT